ncbi:MAG: hypothetical protein K2H83_05915 [Duncaniella sp.]|nr:hypothetical protein [Duncaniella sp.]MDE5734660.1 hypothetical protein [Duncaniella sp.]
MNSPSNPTSNETAVYALWINWVISVGALCVPVLTSVYVPAIAVPLLCILLGVLLFFYTNRSMRDRSVICPLIPSVAYRSLLVSALIMAVILISYSHGIVDRFFETELLNRRIPFLTVLIVSPVTFFYSVLAWLQGTRRFGVCQRCKMVLGDFSERGIMGSVLDEESRFQHTFMRWIWGVVALISWGYYMLFYINVNINVPDKFFLGWVPAILYLISVVYLATRYFTIWAYYYSNLETNDHASAPSTAIRYLILSSDTIFLSRLGEFADRPDQNLYDTPAIIAIDYHADIDLATAKRVFTEISAMKEDTFDIRFMYYSADNTGTQNIFHYIVCPHTRKELEDQSFFKGKWFNLTQLERALHNHDVSRLLASELNRLHTVTMAWKTYDAEGRRLYKIKNYRPSFRFKGICDWDVDFNSQRWLKVARLNQDKPFFRLRRLIDRLRGGDSDI